MSWKLHGLYVVSVNADRVAVQVIPDNLPLAPHQARRARAEPFLSCSTPDARTRPPRETARASLPSESSFQQPRNVLTNVAGPQALCLTIETSKGSFLSIGRSTGSSSKEVKVEVFFNGQLAGLSHINKRGAAVELVGNKVRFQGTRIHRQIEKPWTYDSRSTSTAEREGSTEERWQMINEGLNKEAKARGRNALGEKSPSADCLQALADLAMPEKLEGKQGLGIIDIVITTGTGKKFGPEHGYLFAPTRMNDDAYSIFYSPPDLFSDMRLLDIKPKRASPLLDRDPVASADCSGISPTPSQRRDSATEVPETPTKKATATKELVQKFGLEGVNLKKTIDVCEASCAKSRTPRTVTQRLGDIAKMNPKNQEKYMAELKEQLNEDDFRKTKRTGAKEDERAEWEQDADAQPSPSKRAKLARGFECELQALADFNEEFRDSFEQGLEMPWLPSLTETIDPQMLLKREHTDLDSSCNGFPSDDTVQNIADTTSPTRSPQKKTRASALASSPCSVPVKPQYSQRRPLRTPGNGPTKAPYHFDSTPIPIDPALTRFNPASTYPTTPRQDAEKSAPRPKLGSNRTHAAWNPHEKTAQQVLKEFRVPKPSQGSCVSFAGDGVQRQVGKARGGVFEEERVVVGMRFYVV